MRRPLSTALLLLAAYLIAPAATGASHSGAGRHEAHAILEKIRTSPQLTNFSGTLVHQRGESFRKLRIAHLRDGKNTFEKLEFLGESPREVVRVNGDLVHYFRSERTLIYHQEGPTGLFPIALTGDTVWLADFYALATDGLDKVAGQSCQVVRLVPKDKLRYAFEFCAEASSGLPLRVSLMDDRNQVVEQIRFSQVNIGRVTRSAVRPSMANTNRWHRKRLVQMDVESSQWQFRNLPSGFRRVRDIKKLPPDIVLMQAGETQEAADGKPVSEEVELDHIVYSDGVATLNIAVQRWNDRLQQEGENRLEAKNVVTKRVGDFWLTITGELPAAILRQISQSAEFKPK